MELRLHSLAQRSEVGAHSAHWNTEQTGFPTGRIPKQAFFVALILAWFFWFLVQKPVQPPPVSRQGIRGGYLYHYLRVVRYVEVAGRLGSKK
jgi:hypothetical protein